MLSEWRAFEQGNTTWTLLSVLNIARRWLYQSRLLAAANVHLPPLISNRGHERSRYSSEGRSEHVQSDYPTAAELLLMYAECVAFVQEVLAALGMAVALHEAGLWDEPPLEEWAHVRTAAAATAEQAAQRNDAAQFDGQAAQHEAAQEAAEAATELDGADEEEANEAAMAMTITTATATNPERPTWKAGERHAIAAIMDHANPGSKIPFEVTDDEGKVTGSVEVTIKERYLHVRWAGARYRAKKWWSWEAQSELIAQVPEMVGAYCKAKKLVVPQAERQR
eukprot:4646166-Prymnesium_polylepis.1